MKTLLIINSKDRHYGSSSDFLIGFEQRTQVDNFRVNRVIIPYSWFNLKAQTYVFNGTTHNLPAGSYTVNSLISLINTHIAPFTATYLVDQNKIIFTGLTDITIDFIYGSGYLGTALQYPIDLLPATSTTTGVINLNLTSNVYVSSRALTTYFNCIFHKKQSTVFQTVPVNVNSFGYISHNNQLETVFRCDSQTFANLDIQLLDDAGVIIDMNGLDWIIEIELNSKSPYL